MPLVLADRVRETTTTTGTGTISLAGPVSGFQGFSTAIGNANTTYYTIVDAATGAWEVGLGTYTSAGSTLARTTVLSSSNSDALVPFAAGTKDVFVTQPAERAVYVLGAGTGLAAGAAAFTANGVPYADSTSTLTTGSAMTFDGSALAVAGSTSPQLIATESGGLLYAAVQLQAVSAGGKNWTIASNATSSPLGTAGGLSVRDSSVGTTYLNLTTSGLEVTQSQLIGYSSYAGIGTNGLAVAGNVGIGTSSPSLKLDVNGSAKFAGSYVSFNDNGYIRTDAANILRFQPGSGGYQFRNSVNSDNLAVLDSSGNLGIGESSPTVKLDITGNDRLIRLNATSNNALMRYSQSGTAKFSQGLNDPVGWILFDDVASAYRLVVDYSGNLGIGTSSPGAQLDISTTVSATGAILRLSNQSNAISVDQPHGTIQFFSGDDSSPADTVVSSIISAQATTAPNEGYLKFLTGNNTEKLRIDAAGNLGLGVTPSAWGGLRGLQNGRASLAGQSSEGAWLTNNAFYNGTNWVYMTSSQATMYQQLSGVQSWHVAGSGTAGNAISWTQAMTLDASGNLGVGTTSPSVASGLGIVVNGGAGQARIALKNTNTGDASTDGFQLAVDTSSNAYIDQRENAALIFTTNNAERARITSGGYSKFSNDGTYVNAAGSYHEFRSNEATNFCVDIGSTSASFTAGGVVLIRANRNTTNNTFYALSYYNDAAGAFKFRVADSGDVTNTNGTYGTISDAKMKADIVDAGSQWADIKALRFRKFKMKDDPSGLVQLGVVAQEVELTSPGLVDEHQDRDAEGNDLGTTTKSVKTSVLLMKAAVALQEAMSRIEALEAQVAQLKGA
jgi:hypothetical protein